MKIVDYLIIVSTWLLSSFTFYSHEVEFKNIKEDQGVYYLHFGVVGTVESSKSEIESILGQLPNHEVIDVIQEGGRFKLFFNTTVLPEFATYRSVFNRYGYEMDNRYFHIHNENLLNEIVGNIKKIRQSQTKTN